MSSDYDVGLVCLNGHAVNSMSRRHPDSNAKFCKDCGQPTIDACPSCQTTIRGFLHVPDVIGRCRWDVPAYCHECGKPYPWTDRRSAALSEAIDEADELSDSEREKLKQSIPDILKETPSTDTAVARFKKAIAKAGKVSGKMLYDVTTKVAAEVVVKSLGP